MNPPLIPLYTPLSPAASQSAASSAASSPTQSADGSGTGGSRKRKLQVGFEPSSTASTPTTGLPSDGVPALLPSALLLPSAVRQPSTASTASSTPSPRLELAHCTPHSQAQHSDATSTLSTAAAMAQTALPAASSAMPAMHDTSAVPSPAAYDPSHHSAPPLAWPSVPLQPTAHDLTQQLPVAAPAPASPHSAPPHSVPPSHITRLMPTMQYARIEPSVDQHYPALDGDTLLGRYRVERLLGRGTFSQVVQCRDLLAEQQPASAPPDQQSRAAAAASGRRATDVAIKVVRAVERYRVAAEREAGILQAVQHRRRTQPHATPDGCVELLGSFVLDAGGGGQHLCLVFPVLGLSLYDFLRLNRFRPLFPAHIRHIGYQLLQTLAFLHDECGIIHADIKPENVLLVDSSFRTIHMADMALNVPLDTAIRLIDFGTAVHRTSDHPALVVSRSYRAVEVVLGCGWGDGVDVWAAGCVLMELYTGQRLFSVGQGGDGVHVAAMQRLLGEVPASVLQLPRVYQPSSPTSLVGSPVAGSGGGGGGGGGSGGGGDEVGGGRLRDRVVAGDVKFCDLIERMLTYDPRLRITARQALQHPYFQDAD